MKLKAKNLYLTITEISKKRDKSPSSVKYTLLSAGDLIRKKTENRKKMYSLEDFDNYRKGMEAKNETTYHKFDFDYKALKESVTKKGLTMTQFFCETGLKRNRYYSIMAGLVYPSKEEIEIMRRGL